MLLVEDVLHDAPRGTGAHFAMIECNVDLRRDRLGVLDRRRVETVLRRSCRIGALRLLSVAASLAIACACVPDAEQEREGEPVDHQATQPDSLRSAPPDTTHYVRPLLPGELPCDEEPETQTSDAPPCGADSQKNAKNRS